MGLGSDGGQVVAFGMKNISHMSIALHCIILWNKVK